MRSDDLRTSGLRNRRSQSHNQATAKVASEFRQPIASTESTHPTTKPIPVSTTLRLVRCSLIGGEGATGTVIPGKCRESTRGDQTAGEDRRLIVVRQRNRPIGRVGIGSVSAVRIV